jgi:hypothetical protein
MIPLLIALLAYQPGANPPRHWPTLTEVRAACAASTATLYWRQGDLPPLVRAAIPFEMANPGQPFQVTDGVLPGSRLPFRRMICAEQRNDVYVLHFEHGGIGYSVQSLTLRPGGDGYVAE